MTRRTLRRRIRLWLLASPYTGRDIAVAVIALLMLTVTWSFNIYLRHRADLADLRTERQRAAICAILAALPTNVPAEIGTARRVFARPGHPTDCYPVTHPRQGGVPHVSVTVIVPPSSVPSPIASVRRRPSPAEAPHRAPSPRTAPTKHPEPSHRPSTQPSPSRSPSPRPSICVLGVCLRR